MSAGLLPSDAVAASVRPVDIASAVPATSAKFLDMPAGTTWGEFVHRYREQVRESLQVSHDARDLLLASFVLVDSEGYYEEPPSLAKRHTAASLLRRAAQMAPDDALVQRAWALASYNASGCGSGDPCPERAEAQARLEPDNAAAWEPVVAAALGKHDLVNAERALARMATATHYDNHFGEAALAFRAIYRRFPAPEAPPSLRADVEKNPWFEFPTTAESHQESYAKSAATRLLLVMGDDEIKNEPESMCTREALKIASRQRAMDCARIGRMLLRGNDPNGRFYMAATGLDTAGDREMARTLDWRIWMENETGSHPQISFAMRLQSWFDDVEATGDTNEADRRDLIRRGISPTPPPGWEPEGGVFMEFNGF
ncbi:MAG: hypothetical protein ABI365_07000 [Lysobacteraceae bacterium]